MGGTERTLRGRGPVVGVARRRVADGRAAAHRSRARSADAARSTRRRRPDARRHRRRLPPHLSAMQFAEFFGITPDLHRLDDDGRLGVRGVPRTRRLGRRRGRGRVRARGVRPDTARRAHASQDSATPIRTRRNGRAPRCTARDNPMTEWEMPYGLQGPVGGYALAASRHMASTAPRPSSSPRSRSRPVSGRR